MSNGLLGKEWEHWKSRYANDSKAELEDKINHKEEYQDDAIASAAFLLRELEQHDKEEKQEKEIALSKSGIDLPKQDMIIPPPVMQPPGKVNIVNANVIKLKNFKKTHRCTCLECGYSGLMGVVRYKHSFFIRDIIPHWIKRFCIVPIVKAMLKQSKTEKSICKFRQ